MRTTLALLSLALAACAPAAPQADVAGIPQSPPQAEAAPAPEAADVEEISENVFSTQPKAAPPKLVRVKSGGVDFTAVTFNAKSYTLKVADQAAGPGADFSNAKAATLSLDGVAGINAGFFTPEGKPLGFLYTEGEKRGTLNRSSLGSGVFQIKNGRASLVRRQLFDQKGVTEALQSGPFLVNKGKVVNGLSKQRPRDRSALATDGNGNWAILQSSPTTLHGLAQAMDGLKIDNWTVVDALNLDGGRSCDLYVSGAIAGTPLTKRSFIAKPVRNFLILVEK